MCRLTCTGCGKILEIKLELDSQGRGFTANHKAGLRDRFAEVALAALLKQEHKRITSIHEPRGLHIETIAQHAYQLADAMMRARAGTSAKES